MVFVDVDTDKKTGDLIAKKVVSGVDMPPIAKGAVTAILDSGVWIEGNTCPPHRGQKFFPSSKSPLHIEKRYAHL